jgi:hypothetical protein
MSKRKMFPRLTTSYQKKRIITKDLASFVQKMKRWKDEKMKRNNSLLASHIKLEQNKKIMTKQEKKTKQIWWQNVKAKWTPNKNHCWVGTSFVSHNGQSQISLLFFVIQKPNKCKNWSCEQLTFVHETLLK